MTRTKAVLACAAVTGALLGACTPTVKVQVAPIDIRLTADVRLRLDKEVQELIRNNPDIF